MTHTTRYVQAEWAAAWAELTRERGLWGPPKPSPLDKWALESTEGPNRMRKMMRRNHLFYLHYPYRPELDKLSNVSIYLVFIVLTSVSILWWMDFSIQSALRSGRLFFDCRLHESALIWLDFGRTDIFLPFMIVPRILNFLYEKTLLVANNNIKSRYFVILHVTPHNNILIYTQFF